MEYKAREPPIIKEFHEVTIPHIPPTMMTFAITDVPKAFAMASAVTRPVVLWESAISAGSRTYPTDKITKE